MQALSIVEAKGGKHKLLNAWRSQSGSEVETWQAEITLSHA
ncbi:hypothetical protein [Pseudomonas syringae]